MNVHRHRLVKHSKEIARQQKSRRDDAVEIQKFIKLEINHRLRPHEEDDEGNTEKQERRCSDEILASFPLIILRQRLFEMDAKSRAAILIKAAHHFTGKALYFHLIAFRHIARTDLEIQLHVLRRLLPCLGNVIYQKHAGGRNIHASAADLPLHAAFLPDRAHRNLHLKTAARFGAGHIFFKVLLSPDFIPLIGLPTIHIRPLACDIRHMRKQSPVLLQLLQSIFFLHEFS